MALDHTTDLELQDPSGKDLPKDLVVGDQTLRHSLDVQEYEEQLKNYDPKSWISARLSSQSGNLPAPSLRTSHPSIFRIFSGLGGSACLSIGGGIVSDLFDSNERGVATAVFALGPLLGPVIGPVVGGFLSQEAGWRWVFWLLFILGFLTLLLQIFASRETNLRVIMARKRAFEGKPQRWWHRLDWYGPVELPHADGHRDISIGEAIRQPWKFVFTSPIIGLLCLYLGFVYGLLYLLLTTLTSVFVTIYGWSIGVSGLSYIGLGIGFMLGVVVIGSTSDRIMAKHTKQNNNIPIPEVRLKVCVFFSFLIPLSFFWYGWSAEEHTFWLAPVTGLLCFGLGMIGIFLPIQTYMIDAFPENAATATAALASSRNVVGAFLPLAGPILYEDMGYGWGNTVLGFIALVLIPAPYFIARYGGKLRTRGTTSSPSS
ncbi:hypothetical protein INS49_006609 [Diaporthe citri]|uniref:uncharacterized protein n=1 Tax=Diaporthe citri TaxID=83186 RepID=UPI001C822FBA|nr:uncharacterized protein INS49_006609 [Diaporthe citri]KAG6365003.1 hypothetical protein INS49_006609 [Diaporthe citri]